jgi:hypothetical protein
LIVALTEFTAKLPDFLGRERPRVPTQSSVGIRSAKPIRRATVGASTASGLVLVTPLALLTLLALLSSLALALALTLLALLPLLSFLALALLALLPLLSFSALALLAFLTLLLALLAFLALLPTLTLAVLESPIHRLDATHQCAGFLERLLEWIRPTLAGDASRSLELIPKRLEVPFDLEFERDRGLRVPLLDGAPRVLELLFELGLSDLGRGLLEFAPGLRVVRAAVRRGLVEVAFEFLDRLGHLVLALAKSVYGFRSLRAGSR